MYKKGELTLVNESIKLNGANITGTDFLVGEPYNFILQDKNKNKKHNICLEVTFNSGNKRRAEKEKIVNITDFDWLVMQAFYNIYITNLNNDIEQPNIVYLSDIYTRIHSDNDPKNKLQRDKIKDSIDYLMDTRIKIDYSNFINDEIMCKRYKDKKAKLFKDLNIYSGTNMHLIQGYEVEDINPYNKKVQTMYILQHLPLLDVATIKDRYFTVDSKVYNTMRLSDANISGTTYFLRLINGKVESVTLKKALQEINMRQDPNKRYINYMCNILENIKAQYPKKLKDYVFLDKNNKVTNKRIDKEKIKFIY